MAVKLPKMTMKSLQIELNLFKEELKITRKELEGVKEELNDVKEERKNEKEAVDYPKLNSDNEFSCKICDQTFRLKKTLKKHNQSNHTELTQCKSCDKTFRKACDLELHIKDNHESAGHLECDICGKTFVLKWRLEKHQDIHINKNIRKFHYFNNQKCCPFEAIGCMFAHSLSEKCKYGEMCTKKLCSFQHQKKDVTENEHEDNLENKDDLENLVEDNVGDDNQIEMTEDEEYFDLYVEHNFSLIYEKYVSSRRQINCYLCEFCSKSKILRNIQGELKEHLESNHAEIITDYDPEDFEFENDYHEEFLDFFLQ